MKFNDLTNLFDDVSSFVGYLCLVFFFFFLVCDTTVVENAPYAGR